MDYEDKKNVADSSSNEEKEFEEKIIDASFEEVKDVDDIDEMVIGITHYDSSAPSPYNAKFP